MQEDKIIRDIKIFFLASKPTSPSSKGLTKEKDKATEANFQWVAYQVLFSTPSGDNSKYYIYSVGLNSDGSEKLPDKVFESDSAWSAEKKDIPTKDLTPGEVKMTFPEVLKGPNLQPDKYGQVVYINAHADDKGHEYSSKDFKKLFDNNFYVVLNPYTKELKNPFGKLVGLEGKKEVTEDAATEDVKKASQDYFSFSRAVKNSMEKISARAGGFDIMQKLVKEQKKKMPIRKKN